MSKVRFAAALHLVLVLGLLGWAFVETRRQQAEIERSLLTEASILARALAPGLAAASNAMREFDEIVTWKLLDNARLLAAVDATGAPADDGLAAIVEANGLDSVAFVDRDGEARSYLGEPPPPGLADELGDLLAGRADEAILSSAVEDGVEHVAVAVARRGGGAVLVRIHAQSARTFVRRLGVTNLLERLVGTGGVLYLSYTEEPGIRNAAASWDGAEVPAAAAPHVKLRPVRDRVAFETEVEVDAPAGGRASLRVGLDGTPLEAAAAAGARRTLLVGIVLAAYALATAAFAAVSRSRSLERVEAARRLAQSESARRSSERLAAAGALAAGLAHEVRSPLNAIGLAAQRLERKLDGSGDELVLAGRIRVEVRRLEGVLREFLDLARPVGDERRSVALGALCTEVLELLRPEAEQRGVRLDAVDGEAWVRVDSGSVRRALINLVRNAIAASPRAGRVRVVVERVDGRGFAHVLDEGPGVDGDVAGRVFEPFVTTRADGAGLGLSLVKRVAEEHGGSCSLVSRPGGGAEACLGLPADGGAEG